MLAALSTAAIATLVAFANDPIGFVTRIVVEDIFGGVFSTLIAFATNPVEFIFRIINLFILNGLFAIFNTISGAVLAAFDSLVGALEFAQRALIRGFAAAGIDIIAALASIQRQFAAVFEGAGPLAPVLAAALAVGALVVLSRLAVALLGEVPVGSTIVDLLGLR